jgi:hypothetical protein
MLTALIAAVIAFYASAHSLQIGQGVEVIALTSVATNLAAIVGASSSSTNRSAPVPLATTGRCLAFCIVIAGAALMPTPMRTTPARPDAWSERRLSSVWASRPLGFSDPTPRVPETGAASAAHAARSNRSPTTSRPPSRSSLSPTPQARRQRHAAHDGGAGT